jgi:hypothetical protein
MSAKLMPTFADRWCGQRNGSLRPLISVSWTRVAWDSWPYVFYCLRFETSRFVASYDTQGHGGGIRPRLHTSLIGNGSWFLLHVLGTDRTENNASNSSSIVVCVSVPAFAWRLLRYCLATACLRSRYLSTAVSAGFTILAFSRHIIL